MNPNEIKKEFETAMKLGDAPIGKYFACTISKLTAKETIDYINQLEAEVERLRALKYDRAQYNEGYKVGYSSGMEVFAEALESICWYNSHGPFLMNLAERIESEKDETFLYPEDIKWDTEEHFFWMILVSIFGDYGTSIRCGWIEKKEDCAAFIKRICRLYLSTEEDEV